ncbi:MAG: deoxyguanosinetriphosphate triphosphohydrolase [Candidatus Limivivens sp.]|nr:deoxyguanosinetriphosphate triphosphohydrolase [Candidatus Limivivens sp.]
MTIREMAEQREQEYFSPYASLSIHSRGRDIYEKPCDIRPVYQRDRDRILHCKSFRRLKHKTQVFIKPQGDHYRDRLTHTLEVTQIARTIARALRLNEDLTEAIALGHDLGHTPFGHSGERALNEVCPSGFAHYAQSVRVVELLEKKGKGLNLTWEVRDGIRNHRTSGNPGTLEGKIVRLSDKIAYINHDIDDAERAGILKEEEIPLEYRQALGYTIRERLNTLIHDIVDNSLDKPDVIMSPDMEKTMRELRIFMFDHVYKNPRSKAEEKKVVNMLQQLYLYYSRHLEFIPREYLDLIEEKGESEERVICDYIAGMTDEYAIMKFSEIYIPQSWKA